MSLPHVVLSDMSRQNQLLFSFMLFLFILEFFASVMAHDNDQLLQLNTNQDNLNKSTRQIEGEIARCKEI